MISCLRRTSVTPEDNNKTRTGTEKKMRTAFKEGEDIFQSNNVSSMFT
jgi:flagellar biosynthesis protein FlhB